MAHYPRTIELDQASNPRLYDDLLNSTSDEDLSHASGLVGADMIPGPVKEAIFCLATLEPEEFVKRRCSEPAEGTPVVRIGLEEEKDEGEGTTGTGIGSGDDTEDKTGMSPELAKKSQELGGFCFGLSRPAHPYVSAAASLWVWLMVDPSISGHSVNFSASASFLPARIAVLVDYVHSALRDSGLCSRLLRAIHLLSSQYEPFQSWKAAEKGEEGEDSRRAVGSGLSMYAFPGSEHVHHTLFQNTRPLVSLLLFLLRGRPQTPSSKDSGLDLSQAPDDLLVASGAAVGLDKVLLPVKSDSKRSSLESRLRKLTSKFTPAQLESMATDLRFGLRATAQLLYRSQPNCWTVEVESDGQDHQVPKSPEDAPGDGGESPEEPLKDESFRADDGAPEFRIQLPFAQVCDYYSYLSHILLTLGHLSSKLPELQLVTVEATWTEILEFANSSLHRMDRKLSEHEGMLRMLLRVAPRIQLDEKEELPAAQGPSNGVPSDMTESVFVGLSAKNLIHIVSAAVIQQSRLLVTQMNQLVQGSDSSTKDSAETRKLSKTASQSRSATGQMLLEEADLADQRILGFLQFYLQGYTPSADSEAPPELRSAAATLLERLEEESPESGGVDGGVAKSICASPLCKMSGSSYRRCGRCKRMYYCSAECQKQHWSAESVSESAGRLSFVPHKKTCRR